MTKKYEKSSPKKEELRKLGVFNWKIWESPPPPGFEWEFEEKIMAFIIAGNAEVHSGSEVIPVSIGDLFVVYPEMGKCRWIVKETVRLHYKVL